MTSRFYIRLIIFFFAGHLSAVTLWAITLPAACGNDKVQFDVKVRKNQSLPIPTPGTAQVVFIEFLNDPNGLTSSPIARFAIDGSWVGAAKTDASFGDVRKFSYFTVAVSPGEHHVCSNWMDSSPALRGEAGLDTFTAEEGKVYFYELHIKIRPFEVGMGPNKKQLPGAFTHVITLERVPETEAKEIIKTATTSESKPYTM